MYINELLQSEIESRIEGMSEFEVGSEEFKAAVDGIAKLTDRVIELEKLDADEAERKRKREEEQAKNEFEQNLKREQFKEEQAKNHLENDLKERQIKEEQQDRLIKNCIAVAGIILPIGITIWGTLKTLEFEKEGTVTTIMGRGFINKLLPKK